MINTRTVKLRRKLHLQSFDDLLREAEALTQVEVRPLGNWSLGQILEHLAMWIGFTVDGFPVKVPFPLRFVAHLFRKRIIRMPIPAGFTWKQTRPELVCPSHEVSASEGLKALRYSIERFEAARVLVPSPLLGKLTRDEWEQFHLRHAEHHLSFVSCGEGTDSPPRKEPAT